MQIDMGIVNLNRLDTGTLVVSGRKYDGPLCFQSQDSGASVGMEAVGRAFTPKLQISTDNQQTWSGTRWDGSPIPLRNCVDGKLYLKTLEPYSSYGSVSSYIRFVISGGRVHASGNIQYLLNPDGSDVISDDHAFSSLFYNCTSLVSAPMLPAKTLTLGCYYCMFDGCSSLESAPELPATALAESCYQYMFSRCVALETAPSLKSVTALPRAAYWGMFRGCTGLKTPPPIIAAQSCGIGSCTSMFEGCTSLASAPILQPKTLGASCYSRMFNGCTALTSAPDLPATTLASDCYGHMLSGCSNVNSVNMKKPELMTTQYDQSEHGVLKDGILINKVLD